MKTGVITCDPDVENLHKKFSEYGANVKEWMKKCVLLLPEINRLRIWEKKGFSSIYEYAAKLSGMNHEKVNESLRILGKIADKPALKKVIEKKGLNAIRPIVTIADFDTQSFWAEKAMQLTKNELETYVRDFRNGRVLQIGGRTRTVEEASLFAGKSTNDGGEITQIAPTKKITMELSPEMVAKLEKLKGDGDWETLMQDFLNLREEKIEEAKPEPRETTSRHIPAEIKRFVVGKYNGRCAFPGCNKPYSELHHTEKFFFENKHDPSTIIPLCEAHHSLAHKGLVEEGESSVIPDPSVWKLRQTSEVDFVDRMVLAHKR